MSGDREPPVSLPDEFGLPVRYEHGEPLIYQLKTPGLVMLPATVQTALLLTFVLYILPLEAAILFQLRGAIVMMATATAFYILREAYGTVVLDQVYCIECVTLRMGIGWIIAIVAGLIVLVVLSA